MERDECEVVLRFFVESAGLECVSFGWERSGSGKGLVPVIMGPYHTWVVSLVGGSVVVWVWVKVPAYEFPKHSYFKARLVVCLGDPDCFDRVVGFLRGL